MMTESSTEEGTIPFRIPSTGATAHTYYRLFGDLKNGSTPVIVLHGGPGTGHEYCLPFRKLWSLYNIPTVFYDQIGCAKSSHFPEKVYDEGFWHPDLFVAELDNLVRHFDLDRSDGPGYDILGHSWGAILGNYFASRKPRGLRRLILASGTASGGSSLAGRWKKLEQVSEDAKRVVEQAVAKDDFASPELADVIDQFNRKFLCRAENYPPPLLAAAAKNLMEDQTVQKTYQGRSLFVYDGLLGRWSSLPHLHKIAVPTLLISGEFDASLDSEQELLLQRIPNVRQVTLAGASHMYMLDSNEMEAKTLKLVGDFLQASGKEEKQT